MHFLLLPRAELPLVYGFAPGPTLYCCLWCRRVFYAAGTPEAGAFFRGIDFEIGARRLIARRIIALSFRNIRSRLSPMRLA